MAAMPYDDHAIILPLAEVREEADTITGSRVLMQDVWLRTHETERNHPDGELLPTFVTERQSER